MTGKASSSEPDSDLRTPFLSCEGGGLNRIEKSFRAFLTSNGLDASIYQNCDNIPRYIRCEIALDTYLNEPILFSDLC